LRSPISPRRIVAAVLAARDAEELIHFCLELPSKGEALWEKEYRRCVFDRSLDVPALQALSKVAVTAPPATSAERRRFAAALS